MNKTNKVKFFLVASALIASASSLAFADDEGGANDAAGTSFASDNADKPYVKDCHSCAVAAQANIPRNGFIEPLGSAATSAAQTGHSGATDNQKTK